MLYKQLSCLLGKVKLEPPITVAAMNQLHYIHIPQVIPVREPLHFLLITYHLETVLVTINRNLKHLLITVGLVRISKLGHPPVGKPGVHHYGLRRPEIQMEVDPTRALLDQIDAEFVGAGGKSSHSPYDVTREELFR